MFYFSVCTYVVLFCARVGPTPDRARTEGVVAGSADGGSLRDKGLLVRFHAPRPGPWHIHPPSFWKAARAVELTCVPAFSMGTAELDLMPPSALVDYLMDLAPRRSGALSVVDWLVSTIQNLQTYVSSTIQKWSP